MKPFRCTSPDCAEHPAGKHEFDFWAGEPKCPKCGADARDPRSARLIVALVPIHFDPPGPWHRGLGRYACTPDRAFGRDPATGDPSVVTCPLCKATDAYREAAASWGFEVITELTPEQAAALQAAAATKLRQRRGTTAATAGG